MIHAGTDLKFRVTAEIAGFSLTEDNFSIVVRNRWGQTVLIANKGDMFTDTQGAFYFTLPQVKKGIYYATFTAEKEDTDFDGEIQHIVDQQPLVNVGSCDCDDDEGIHVCPTEGAVVMYERVWIVSVTEGSYIADKYGNPILDSEGNKIYVSSYGEEPKTRLDMTGKEVKELLEGHSEDGKINTVPEVMDVLGGMDENTELSPMSNDDVDNMMERILNNNR